MIDIQKIIDHPDIQRKVVLAGVLGISCQSLNNWIARGLSKENKAKIDSNEVIQSLDFSKRKRKALNRAAARDFAKSMNIKEIAEATEVDPCHLMMCRKRGAVSMSIARKMQEKMDIPTSVSRPDIPSLAFEHGIKNWYS